MTKFEELRTNAGMTITQLSIEANVSRATIEKIEKEFPDQKEVFYAKEADHFHLPPKEDVYTKMEALIFHFKMMNL